MLLFLVEKLYAPRPRVTSNARAMLVQRWQLQQRCERRRMQLTALHIRRRQLLHRQQVRDLAGRAADREARSPPFPLEAVAAATAHRCLVVQRYRVAVIADLTGQYRAIRRYHIALETYRALGCLRDTIER